jgi:hypothetical protein
LVFSAVSVPLPFTGPSLLNHYRGSRRPLHRQSRRSHPLTKRKVQTTSSRQLSGLASPPPSKLAHPDRLLVRSGLGLFRCSTSSLQLPGLESPPPPAEPAEPPPHKEEGAPYFFTSSNSTSTTSSFPRPPCDRVSCWWPSGPGCSGCGCSAPVVFL